MPLTANLTRFKTLVRDIARVRGKEQAEVLNKGLTTAIIGSSKYKGIVQLAPKAKAASIRGDLRRNKLGIRLAVAQMKREGWFASPRSRVETQQEISRRCEATLKARLKSRAYIAAGWIRALQDIGFLKSKGRGQKETQFWGGGSAATGYGVPASARRLMAAAFSMSRGSEKVLAPYMQQAIQGACEDMADYFRAKLGKTLARLSRI